MGNNADPDDDNDGILDADDAFPYNSTYGSDMDGDGLPDSLDLDIDGDDYPNSEDAFPQDFTEWMDTDGDGIGNNRDNDDDGDGVIDILDSRPLDAGESSVISNEDSSSDSADSEEDGVITISIQDILILLAISSAATITFLWRAKKNRDSLYKEEEKEA